MKCIPSAPMYGYCATHVTGGCFLSDSSPNPLPENRALTADAVTQHGAAGGIARVSHLDHFSFAKLPNPCVAGYYVVELRA